MYTCEWHARGDASTGGGGGVGGASPRGFTARSCLLARYHFEKQANKPKCLSNQSSFMAFSSFHESPVAQW